MSPSAPQHLRPVLPMDVGRTGPELALTDRRQVVRAISQSDPLTGQRSGYGTATILVVNSRRTRNRRRMTMGLPVSSGSADVTVVDAAARQLPRLTGQCSAAFAIAAARSVGRLHIGQCPVGRSTSSRSRKVATSAIIGCPSRAIFIIT